MTVITQLPDPPSRTTPSQFSARTDAFLGALPGFVTETNAVASEVNADKTTAVNSAAIAVQKATEAEASALSAVVANTATKWVSGTSYVAGVGVWSPINYLAYRRKTAGSGTTDPSLDTTNWVLIGVDPSLLPTHAAATTGVHGLGTASQKDAPAAGDATTTQVVLGSDTRLTNDRYPTAHTTGSHSDWPAGVTMAEVGHLDGVTSAIQAQLNSKFGTYVAYDSRDNIRALSPASGDLLMVEGLGAFRWYSGSTELDDDETCFATASGRWILEYPHPEMVYAMSLADNAAQDEEIYELQQQVDGISEVLGGFSILFGTAVSSITSVATLTQVSFTGTVTGATPGDRVIATPDHTPGARMSWFARVTAADTVTVYLNNPSASAQTLTTDTWKLAVIKEAI